MDYNLEQLNLIFKLLKLKKEIALTSAFEKAPTDHLDLRNFIHPKIEFNEDVYVEQLLKTPYYQTFETKFDFHSNLSILDLLFNKGLETREYLKKNDNFKSQ